MLFRVFIVAGVVGLLALAGSGCSGCDSGGFPSDGPPLDAPAPGTVTLAWSLRTPNGQPIRCDQVGGSFVLLQLRNRANLLGAVVSFSCANSPSTSQELEPGVYDITFQLNGVDLTSVTAPEQRAVTVSPGEDTELAPVVFVIDARGSLVLSLAAPPTTFNCRSTAMMGAGITGTTIALVHTGGGCAPVTFVRARGSTVVETYIVNCSDPRIASCIERDETLTATNIESGPYMIQVRGRIGQVDCWKNDNALQVPPQGKTRIETLNLAFQMATQGC